MLIKVKMPTIVAIIIFISMINTRSEGFKASLYFSAFCFDQLNFHSAQLSCTENTAWAWFFLHAINKCADQTAHLYSLIST